MAQRLPVPIQILNILFAPRNVEKMMKVMESPMRELMQLHLSQIETFISAIIAGQGDPMQTTAAIMYGALEHMEDPLKAMEIMLRGTLYHKER